MSVTRSIKLDSLINKAFQDYYAMVNCPDIKQMMEKAYDLGRTDEREHCKAIAARVRKELDKP